MTQPYLKTWEQTKVKGIPRAFRVPASPYQSLSSGRKNKCMEVVGGVASVVGILAFTGQATKGLLKLKQLVQDATESQETIKRVVESIRLLRVMLKDVENVAQKIEKLSSDKISDEVIYNCGALTYQTKACAQDVPRWIKVARLYDSGSGTLVKSWVRKLQIASERGTFGCDSSCNCWSSITYWSRTVGIVHVGSPDIFVL